MGEISMRRIKIEVALLTAILVAFLCVVVVLSTYECFEDKPKVFHRACNVDFWAQTAADVFTLR